MLENLHPDSSSSTAAQLTDGAAWRALAPLLLGTFIGTLNNNIVNVPMKRILADLHVPLARGSLVVIAFNATFAVLMPLTGWYADRIGQRRLFIIALVVLTAGSVGAALAPSLPVLVIFRVIQATATAAILPSVMAMIGAIFGPVRRGRALGLWAGVNGLGQAVGPPLGGLLAAWLSWRAIFWPAVPLAVMGVAATVRYVPPDRGRAVPFEWKGAVSLTAGAGLLLIAAAAGPITGWLSPEVLAMTSSGLVGLALCRRFIRTAEHPFLAPALFREPSYLRSCVAVAAQMFCLGAMLLAVPLYLTQPGGDSTTKAGVIVFALPAAMTLLAPLAGLLTESLGPRSAIRIGISVLAVAQAGLAWHLAVPRVPAIGLVLILGLAGAGVAFVQAPAATGATRSPVGRHGAALGVFNLVRFAGSALGAIWVTVMLSHGRTYPLLFAVCAGVACMGLLGTWAGRGPDRPGSSAG